MVVRHSFFRKWRRRRKPVIPRGGLQMRISEIKYRNDALDKLTRLGLAHIFLEIENVIFATLSRGEEARQTCERLTDSMKKVPEWTASEIAGLDWIKSFRYRKTLIASIGLKICIPDISGIGAFAECLKSGLVDVGIIIVLEKHDDSGAKEAMRRQLDLELENFTEAPYIILFTELDY